MRAILIDPEMRTVSYIQLPRDAVEEMHTIIGCEGLDHMTISDMHDSLWVDDMGLRKGPVYAFKLPIARDPIPGRAIVIGADEAGRTCPPFFPIDILRREIEWLGRIVPEVNWFEEGNRHYAVVTYAREK